MTNTVIGLLLFPNITQLDLTGPFEVFAKMPGADVRLIWKTLEPVRAESGMHILPNTTLADCPALDVIVVPGGPGMNPLMEDEEVLSFLRVHHAVGMIAGFDRLALLFVFIGMGLGVANHLVDLILGKTG